MSVQKKKFLKRNFKEERQLHKNLKDDEIVALTKGRIKTPSRKTIRVARREELIRENIALSIGELYRLILENLDEALSHRYISSIRCKLRKTV